MNKIKALVFALLLAPPVLAAVVAAANAPKKVDFKFQDEQSKRAPVAQQIELPAVVISGTETRSLSVTKPKTVASKKEKKCDLRVTQGSPRSMVLVCDVERTGNDRITLLK